MFIAFLALQATAPPPIAVTNSPPPPIMVAPVPPPMIRAVPMPPTPTPPSALLDVELLHNSDRLWSGELRVGRESAIVTHSISQTEASTCPPSAQYNRSVTASYSLRISRMPMQQGDSFHMAVSRSRTDGACNSNGTRGLTLDKPFELAPGGRLEIVGDGGLRVLVRRR